MALVSTLSKATLKATPAVRAIATVAAAPGHVDVHTHVYLPAYMDLLRSRTQVPRVARINNEDRLIILPGEDEESTTAVGRPVGSEYYDPLRKLAFMDTHGIGVSVLSLANPWLDFLEPKPAEEAATRLNEELQKQCEKYAGRFFGFATLPTTSAEGCLRELERVSKMDRLRGIILSTRGRGQGLDHPDMIPVFQQVDKLGLTIFVHPHYGVGNEHFGQFGHALFLALGFTFETTTAIARLVLSGAMDKVPNLKLLLAHTGGTLPFLAGRLDSCVKGDPHLKGKLQHAPSTYLKRLYYDSLSYHQPALLCGQSFVGTESLMFGTDHPFFPPNPEEYDPKNPASMDTVTWSSTKWNIDVAKTAGPEASAAILGGNARRLLRLH